MVKTQAEALRLYRAIYRAAGKMPTRDRTSYVRRRLRHEYDNMREEKNPERIRFFLRLAETQLETVQVQAEHLTSTFSSPDYHC
ncbi:Complex 1 LYR protein [Plasmopara halstedii]|uniref:Complex 1 LYR protein n=1 Tax=Plasmopara halstedii TaxID=4781 RepID=A0A0P1AW52_PLAHL|nr:Complex 1 LYR protein [Plasmopara halstedii]CEG45662.1 Complex 1 LYR protein [Plasmopara halstedii]|eukprot:XP_024582031.1 Complex 1 LYR protein [Plasmopara halstedii]